MPLVLLDVGADEILKTYFNNYRPVGGNNLTLRLFATSVVPGQTGITYAEAVGGGYAAKVLTSGSWVLNPTLDPSRIEYASQSFTFSGALTTNPNIYGYYVTDADGVVLWAELLPAAFVPPNGGDPLVIVPTFQLSSGTPT